MSRKKLVLWESYREIRNDYLQDTPLDALSLELRDSSFSEHAVFMYAATKIKEYISQEIELVDSSQETIKQQFVQDYETLLKSFNDKVQKTITQFTPEEEKRKIERCFLDDAKAMVRKYEAHIESEQSWKPFIKNVLLLLSAIGTLPALYSLGNRYVNGYYQFFDNKTIDPNRVQKTPLPSQSVEISLSQP
ncbi:hypothetical protein [Legionella cardiaca]|uniref:Uncharacterized protein n=1 Tax=Legionella cardiaca TaxID=1071983 RepID=A0ABY8ASW7_9GAMM|nr:hypothetical protein [Legionella cardiaca]WED42262.1 hypothetical protein PXX05_10020 [Legionella cardiaca]